MRDKNSQESLKFTEQAQVKTTALAVPYTVYTWDTSNNCTRIDEYDCRYQKVLFGFTGLTAAGLNSKYFLISSGGNAVNYYVWFNYNSTGVNPAPAGKTAIVVALAVGDSVATIITKTIAAINAVASFISKNYNETGYENFMSIVTNLYGVTTAASDFNSGINMVNEVLGTAPVLMRSTLLTWTSGNCVSSKVVEI